MGSVWVESRTSGRMQCLCVNICVCMYVYILHVCVHVCICAWEQLKKKKRRQGSKVDLRAAGLLL